MLTAKRAFNFMLDNGELDNSQLMDVARFSPTAQGGKGALLKQIASTPSEGQQGAQVLPDGASVEKAAAPQQMNATSTGHTVRGEVPSDGSAVAHGRVDPNKTYGDNYPPGPNHVAHQDDWLNPDVSKLPPHNPPTGTHTITKDEARTVPVVLGGLATVGGIIAGGGVPALIGGVGGYMLSTDGAKDTGQYWLEGKQFDTHDPDMVYLDKQQKGYVD